MANCEEMKFPRVVVSLGVCAFLAVCCDCRPASAPGTATTTKVTNFRWFFNRIANPCETSPASGNALQQGSTSTTTTMSPTPISGGVPRINFYHSMESALTETLIQLRALESADPSLPECNGISLDSLPVTPPLDNMNYGEAVKQSYKSILYLTTHFHLMTSDRQVSVTGDDALVTDQQLESDGSLPSWRFQRCGNETESFPSILVDVTNSLENVLCTILTSATAEQTQSFREPLNSLQETVLYRYHASCSTLQTRDCLVVREAKQSLSLISRKYTQLIQHTNNTNTEVNGLDSSLTSNFDDMDNTI